MSVEEKQPFLDMAETLKRQHHIDHPDYKFKPKQRSTTGNKISTNKQRTTSFICSFIFDFDLRTPIDFF